LKMLNFQGIFLCPNVAVKRSGVLKLL